MMVQARIPAALAALHNYVRLHDPEDEIFVVERETLLDASTSPPNQDLPGEYRSGYVSTEERNRASVRRDQIAQELWEQYQAYLEENGYFEEDFDV